MFFLLIIENHQIIDEESQEAELLRLAAAGKDEELSAASRALLELQINSEKAATDMMKAAKAAAATELSELRTKLAVAERLATEAAAAAKAEKEKAERAAEASATALASAAAAAKAEREKAELAAKEPAAALSSAKATAKAEQEKADRAAAQAAAAAAEVAGLRAQVAQLTEEAATLRRRAETAEAARERAVNGDAQSGKDGPAVVEKRVIVEVPVERVVEREVFVTVTPRGRERVVDPASPAPPAAADGSSPNRGTC